VSPELGWAVMGGRPGIRTVTGSVCLQSLWQKREGRNVDWELRNSQDSDDLPTRKSRTVIIFWRWDLGMAFSKCMFPFSHMFYEHMLLFRRKKPMCTA
jgi:hypothetical protein